MQSEIQKLILIIFISLTSLYVYDKFKKPDEIYPVIIPDKRLNYKGYIKKMSFKECDSDEHCKCLAYNIYHEGRGESVEGQIAIAKVTLNRVVSNKYPNNFCDVVNSFKQFSWTHLIENKWEIKELKQWRTARQIAYNTINNNIRYNLKSEHYLVKGLQTNWSIKMTVEKEIGNHIFYLEKER